MPIPGIDKLTASGFSGNVLEPDSERWTEATQAWGAQSKRSPKFALQPQSAEDVSKAILWLNDAGLDFSIRSGGVAESQSDDVIIDLGLLNKIDYNTEKKVLHLGPGQLWTEVYKRLADTDVTVLGGRVSYVGVGGFTLGGGLSYLAGLHGLACDSLMDAQIVLADGSIKWASEDEDLLFALKGAGHAFGAVTELIVKAYPKPKEVYGGFLIFTLDKYEAISKRLSDLANNNKDSRVNAMAGLVRMPPEMLHIIILMPLIFGSAEFAKKELSWAFELGPIQDLSKPVTWEEALAAQDMFVHRPGPGTTYQQTSVVVSKLTPAIFQAALDWQVKIQADPKYFGAALLIEPFFPGSLQVDDSKTAWPHSSPSLHVVEIFIEGPNGDPAEEKVHLRAAEKSIAAAAEPGTVLLKYPNYALVGNPAVEFYGKNLPRLQAIKNRVDPKNRFNKGIQIV